MYGQGKSQTTRIAAANPATGELEEKDVSWFKTDFSRHVMLANEECELGDRTNRWVFALLKNWLRSAFVPVNRRFSVLQSVLRSCDVRLSSYFKVHPKLVVSSTDDPLVKTIRAHAKEDAMRLNQTSVDLSGLLLTRPNSFTPSVDVVQDVLYTIFMDVPGMTQEDIQLSRQNVTTIIKGSRRIPYPELNVEKVERNERTYGDFTLAFKVPQEYERKFTSVQISHGVLKLVFRRDADEDSIALTSERGSAHPLSRSARASRTDQSSSRTGAGVHSSGSVHSSGWPTREATALCPPPPYVYDGETVHRPRLPSPWLRTQTMRWSARAAGRVRVASLALLATRHYVLLILIQIRAREHA